MQRYPRVPIAFTITELHVGYLRRGKRMGAAMLLAHRIEAKPKTAPRIQYARNARSAYNPRTVGHGCQLERFAQWWPVPILLGLSCGHAFLPKTSNNAFENKKIAKQICFAIRCFAGGDDGDRTHDLNIANVALSQLSYIPSEY